LSQLGALCGLWNWDISVERIRMSTMAETKAPAARPLSPHLQIYKPMLTMTMSIAHRITGIGLYFGMLILAWWLIAAASPSSYARFEWFAGSIIGRLILFGFTWALIHHLLGGIRHLIWDTGRGFGPAEREWLAAANLIGSIAITVLLWIFGLLAMGGPL
jgi:succinate dehydrogenase cytochrome b subunit